MERKRTRIISIIVILVLLGGLGYVLYFVYNNTSILQLSIPDEALEKNNFNDHLGITVPEGETDVITLEPQSLIIPDKYRKDVFSENRSLNVPKGFSISVYASGMDAPRFFAFDDSNTMIIADKGRGALYALPDSDNDGIADKTIIIDTDLEVPHSVFWYEGDLYSAEEDKVVAYRDFQSDGTYSSKEVIISDLPTGWADGTAAGHQTRTIVVGPDEKLYVSVGSSCNVCEEVNPKRAAIVCYNLDGTGEELYAEGLRNSVGIGFKNDNELWAVNNGRDRIGDDIPPEEVNVITEAGKHYGWPYCYGDGKVSPEYEGERESFCQNETEFPRYNMQAHSAPLGMTFVPDNAQIPDSLSQDIIIGFHGSWNRTTPTGYKVVRIDTSDADAPVINFITGWLEENGEAWGRPVGVGFDNNGVFYVSDDKAGAVYRVEYTPESA